LILLKLVKNGCKNIFDGWSHQIPEVIEATPKESIIQSDIIDRPPVREWGRGRIVLMGDAIHPTTPNMGQGACMAIESAQVLANMLRSELPLQQALQRYEKLRLPRTTWITTQSWKVGSTAHWEHPLACWLRNTMLKMAPAPLMRNQILKLISYNAASELP
jgi:2-polyprenyl-6-methoxyphenol hydroxylase-like FAD-dependent oxidoreductase